MALSFEVYPGRPGVPSTANVLRLGAHKTRTYLRSLGIREDRALTVDVLRFHSGEGYPLDLRAPFVWPDDYAAWIGYPGLAGDTVVTLHPAWIRVAGEIAPDWLTLDGTDPAVVETAWRENRCWSFRRSAGQPALIVALFGFLASALAQLTQGVVWTTDAWDVQRFPASAADFDRWYLRPEAALSDSSYSWAATCQRWLHEEQEEQ